MNRFFVTTIMLIVALGLGGCAGSVKPPQKAVTYDDTKSHAYNVLNASTELPISSTDSPGGGITKPHKDVEAKDLEEIMRAEAENNRNYDIDPHIDGALDIGLGAAYNSMIDSGWSSSALTTGGLNNLENAGIGVGLLLLQNLTKPQYEGATIDHSILIFGWIPKGNLSAKEAEEKYLDILFEAYSLAAQEHEMAEPYSISSTQRDGGTFKLPVWVGVKGSWCDIERVHCRFGAGNMVLAESAFFPEFLEDGGNEAWQLTTWGVDSPVFDDYLFSPPDGYEKPAFEELTFLQKVSENLPKSFYMLLPGKSGFNEVVASDGEDNLTPLLRPVLLHQGVAHLFLTPPEITAELREEKI